MPGSADRRFARALDGGDAGGAFRRELVVVGLLVSAGAAAGPDVTQRVRMHDRILDELAATPVGFARDELPEPVSLAARRRSAAAGVQGRLLVAAAAALCMLVALSGMSLVLARDALPGDALYGVKRSAESAKLGLTFGDEPRGFKHLQFATARVDEIEALAARGSTADVRRFVTVLQSFDVDAAAGSRLLVESATNGNGNELSTLRDWAEQQRLRLENAATTMPARVAPRIDGTLALLAKVRDRATRLQPRMTCLTVTSGTRDEVGLLPAADVCVPEEAPSVLTTSRQPASPPGLHSPAGSGPSLVIPPPGEERPTDPLPFEAPAITTTKPARPSGTAAPGESPASAAPTLTLPLPLPLPEFTLPPLLPGLPGLKIG